MRKILKHETHFTSRGEFKGVTTEGEVFENTKKYSFPCKHADDVWKKVFRELWCVE